MRRAQSEGAYERLDGAAPTRPCEGPVLLSTSLFEPSWVHPGSEFLHFTRWVRCTEYT